MGFEYVGSKGGEFAVGECRWKEGGLGVTSAYQNHDIRPNVVRERIVQDTSVSAWYTLPLRVIATVDLDLAGRGLVGFESDGAESCTDLALVAWVLRLEVLAKALAVKPAVSLGVARGGSERGHSKNEGGEKSL